MRVAIIGGGIIGCTIALALADRGVNVWLAERAGIGGEASGAAAGILGAQAELRGRLDRLELFRAARSLWPAWAQELGERSGVSVGFRRSGVLQLAFTESEARELQNEAH